MDSDSRACVGDINIPHCVQQQLVDELSVPIIFMACPTVKGLTLSGAGIRQIVLDTEGLELLEYMGTQETNTISAVSFRDLDSHLCSLTYSNDLSCRTAGVEKGPDYPGLTCAFIWKGGSEHEGKTKPFRNGSR